MPETEPAPTRFEFDPANTRKHVQHLVDLKQSRDQHLVSEKIRQLYQVSREGNNAHQAMIDALVADASIGEVWGTLRVASGLSYDPYNVLNSPFAYT